MFKHAINLWHEEWCMLAYHADIVIIGTTLLLAPKMLGIIYNFVIIVFPFFFGFI
jgi:hypothetical protein